MQQTVIQVGNSLAVTLPAAFVKESKLKAGQKVFVQADTAMDLVQVKTKQPTTALTPEFYEWLKKFNAKYKTALTELAKK
jgi:antitoxin component of MazEF toxin-antitoxin module